MHLYNHHSQNVKTFDLNAFGLSIWVYLPGLELYFTYGVYLDESIMIVNQVIKSNQRAHQPRGRF